jgi:hypothetical protein
MQDTRVYAGWESPHQVQGQKIWQHRCSLTDKDADHFKQHISAAGLPYIPDDVNKGGRRDPFPVRVKRLLKRSPGMILRILYSRLFKKDLPEAQIYDGVRD